MRLTSDLPVTLRPVSGVTVSLVGRDSHDDSWDSVTIGVATRRPPSRVPYAMNVIGRRRYVIHHLASTPCARLSAVTFRADRPKYRRTPETWVSVFPGERLRYFWVSHEVAVSPMVIDIQAIQLLPYQPTLAVTSWIPNFSSCRFSSRLCIPLGFPSFRVRTMSLRGSGSFHQPPMRAIHCIVTRCTGLVHLFVGLYNSRQRNKLGKYLKNTNKRQKQ
jgi:hypothetical protein